MVIESKSETNIGFITDQSSNIDARLDLISEFNVNCRPDFDLVSENNLNLDGEIASDEIYFNGKLIKDYSESRSNRVRLMMLALNLTVNQDQLDLNLLTNLLSLMQELESIFHILEIRDSVQRDKSQ